MIQKFYISRIHTFQGIFKLKGTWDKNTVEMGDINVIELAIMSTDGWVTLVQQNANMTQFINKLMCNIHHEIIAHLQG